MFVTDGGKELFQHTKVRSAIPSRNTFGRSGILSEFRSDGSVVTYIFCKENESRLHESNRVRRP